MACLHNKELSGGLNVDGSHIAVRGIHGTRKCKRPPAALRVRASISNHPVVAARPVVEPNRVNTDFAVAISHDSFLDGSLTGVEGPIARIPSVAAIPSVPIARLTQAIPAKRLNLRVENSAIVEIDGTREAKSLIAPIPSQVKNALDGIALRWIIIGLEPPKGNIRDMKAFHGLLPNRVLTGTHCIVR